MYRPSLRPSVRQSVRLSVTRVDQSKTVEVRIMQLSPQSSPMTLVSSRLTSPRRSKGNTGNGPPNEKGVGKIHNFQPISRRISEAVQDMTKVTMRTNRKSHTRFRLVPKSWMTSNCYKFTFSRNVALLRIFGRQQQLNK